MLPPGRTIIVDEIHAVADENRGSNLALTLARLDALVAAAGGPSRRTPQASDIATIAGRCV